MARGMRQNMNVVCLGVNDLARSRAFYEALGWTVTAAPAQDIVFFQAGGAVISLYPTRLLAKDAHVPPEGEGFRRFTLAHCTRSENEVDQVIQAAEHAGAKILKRPAKTFWGGYGAYFKDPDGFIWEVAHNPAWTLDRKGDVMLVPNQDEDDDLEGMTQHELKDEVRRLRNGIRVHRDSTRHELCWHHPDLWGLLPERTDPLPEVPDWPDFMRGCIRYRLSLDEQAPHAPRVKTRYKDETRPRGGPGP